MSSHFTEKYVIETEVVTAIRKSGYQLNSKADLQPLFDHISDSRIVMLGEASHGTKDPDLKQRDITKKRCPEYVFAIKELTKNKKK